MAYEPTNWKTGDVVTSAKLNKLENAVANGGGVLVVHENEGTLDKTWKEIHDATLCVLGINSETALSKYIAYEIFNEDGEYGIAFFCGNESLTFITSSESGYPVIEQNGGILPGE